MADLWRGDQDLGEALAHLAEVRRGFRRHVVALLAWVVICNLGAGVYLRLERPDYIARVELLLQPRHLAEDGPEAVRRYHQFALDSEQAETQLQIIRSERLLRPVYDRLNLAGSPEIVAGRGGLWAAAMGQIHRLSPHQGSGDNGFDVFTDRVGSRRLGLSYVFDISYRAQSGEQAARVANAVASAYVGDRIAQAIAGARTGIPYLQRRSSDILAESVLAQAALARGTVPRAELPDADVRILGPAVVPLGPAFPKPLPTLLVATAFGMVSSALGVIAFGVRRGAAARPLLSRRPGRGRAGRAPPSTAGVPAA